MNTADVFNIPHPGGLHLINKVQQLLESSGLNAETSQVFLTNPDIIYGQTLCNEAQRFLLNRFWTLQLMHLSNVQKKINPSFDTMDQRYCLVDSGDFNVWVSLFTKKILPVVIEYRLPKHI